MGLAAALERGQLGLTSDHRKSGWAPAECVSVSNKSTAAIEGVALRSCRYAEAELAKARDAAQQMMELSNQIQQMFSLCEVSGVLRRPHITNKGLRGIAASTFSL